MSAFRRFSPHRLGAVIVAIAAAVVTGTPAAAHEVTATGYGVTGIGYDVSYPQCGFPLPVAPGFAVVGVNGGRAFKANPCLAEQLAWAQGAANGAPSFYANTGNPGPAYSAYWPIGQTNPQACDAGAPNSSACSFDYGWNAAKNSFDNAVRAHQAVNGLDPATAADRSAAARWWLDVEILNSWQTLEPAYGTTSAPKWNDVYALAGAVRALWDSGVTFVGIYSTEYQWNLVTGGPSFTKDWFAGNPVWLAGFTEASAPSGCGARGFTGGRVVMTQYLAGGFDNNYPCGT